MRLVTFLPMLVALTLTAPVRAADPAPAPAADPYAPLAQFDFGQDRSALNAIDASIREAAGDAAKLAPIEERLAAVLRTPGLKPGAQDYVCRALSVIGTAKSVPALAPLLKDDRSADVARIALERIPGEAAGAALRAALPGATGRARIGILQSLGVRADATAVPAIAALLGDADAATAAAAAQALGRIADDAAATALLKCGQFDVPAIADGALLCADRVAGRDKRRAAKIYLAVTASAVEPAAEAAMIGLAKVQPAEVAKMLLEGLGSADEKAVARAIRLAGRLHPEGFAKPAAKRLAQLKPAGQVPLLAILGDLGDAEARPAVIEQLKSTEESVRVAAIDALGGLPASRESLDALAGLTGDASRPVAQGAARALVRVAGADVEKMLLAGAAAGPAERRRAFIAAVGDRQLDGAENLLLGLRKDADAEIRRAALKALDKVARPETHAAVVTWMLGATDAAESHEAEGLAGRLGARAPKAVDELVAADAGATPEGRVLLARCLAKRGGDAALKQVRAYLASGQAALELEALKALSSWPDAAPLEDLLGQAGSADTKRAVLATQGALRLLSLDAKRTVEQKAAVCASLVEKSSQPDVRKAVLSALAEYPCAKAAEVAAALGKDPACATEAQSAAARIRQALMKGPDLTASHNAGELKNAVDNNPGTRWTTGASMAPGMWLMLDLHQRCVVHRIVLDAGASGNDYPRGYSVRVGDSADALGAPVLTGQGTSALTELKFDPPQKARFVRIEQTGSAPQWYWSVHELKVDAEPAEATP